MNIKFTNHARRRIRERGLRASFVKECIRNPDSEDVSFKNPQRFLFKKTYYHLLLKKRHLLMAICERETNRILVVTIIDTSKIDKYTTGIW